MKSAAHAPPKTSSRAFLALPEVPASGAASDEPEPSSPVEGIMSLDFDDFPHGNRPAGHPDLATVRDSHSDANDGRSSSTPRGRSSQTTTPAPSRKRTDTSSPPPPPPPKRQRREPQFTEGYEVVAGVKPKAADYEPTVQALLLRTMLEYSMRILTIKGFPDIGLQVTWARDCFRNACRAASEHFNINQRMIKLVSLAS